MIDAVSQPLITMQQATGKVKNYQIIVGGILLLNIPLSYISCFYGSPPESVFYISILIAIVCLIARILILRMNIKLDVIRFAKSVLLRIVIVTIISIIPPLCLAHIFHDENFLLFSINSAICMISVCGSVFLVGLTEEEKAFVLKNTHKLFKKLKK